VAVKTVYLLPKHIYSNKYLLAIKYFIAIYWHLPLHFAGIGQALMLLTCNVIIQQRFRFSKHRSFATAISVIGFSVGNFVGAPLTQLMLDRYGLRGTLALLGAIQSHRIPLALQFRSPKRLKAASNQTEVGHFYSASA